jgi:hypothetical protein
MSQTHRLFAFFLLFVTKALFAQDDMLSLLDSAGAPKHEKVFATFKGSKIINMQSTETVKPKTMDFTVTHLFGNAGHESGGGVHQLFGFDNAADIRIGFDFGITRNLTMGIGRSKQFELLDALIKYRVLTQTTDNHIPLTLAVYSDLGYSPQTASQFYAGAEGNPNFKQNDLYRFSYTTELLIARKFNRRLSIQLAPLYQHRNFVIARVNPSNGSVQSNDLFALGGGFRFMIGRRWGIVGDYYYIFSDYRRNNPTTPYQNPLSLGVEIETGGHVFHINFSNASGIVENNYIPYTSDNWFKGGFKFGFTISRVFNIKK